MKPLLSAFLQTAGRVVAGAGAAVVEQRVAQSAAKRPPGRRPRKKGGCTPCEAIARAERAQQLAQQGRIR